MAQLWLDLPHPALGGGKPRSYLDAGELQVLEYAIYAIATGQPA